MAEIPVIQVLSRSNYEEQHMIALPDAHPLPALLPSSVRIKTSIISLTTNNFSYARFDHMLGWWDIHVLPESIPKEYSDPNKFGRISGWGYGYVIESNALGIEIGTQVYGYLPIGTLPVDVEAQVDEVVPNQFVVTSKHRQHVLPVYNRYLVFPQKEFSDPDSLNSQGYDSLMRILFETSYMMNRFVFAWESFQLVHPSGDPNDGWTMERADIGPKTTVVIFSAGGKTALSLAHQLKHSRPIDKFPAQLLAFSQATGLYEKVLTYEADSGDLLLELGLHPDSKLVICDFGARGNTVARWVAKLQVSHNKLVQVDIGGEVKPVGPEKVTADFMAREKGSTMLNASGLRSQAMDIVGGKQYFEDFSKEWEAFKAQGGIKGLTLAWGTGMNDLKEGWDDLAKGKIGPDQGLVYKL